MRTRGIRIVIFTGSFLAAFTAAQAFNLFLFVDGIPGESMSRDGWSEASAFTHDILNSGSEPTLTVTKDMDKMSPRLALKVNDKSVIPDVVLEVAFNGNTNVYYRIRLFDAQVDNMVLSGDTSNTNQFTPSEQIQFTAGRIEWEYIRYDGSFNIDETISECWDITNNVPCP